MRTRTSGFSRHSSSAFVNHRSYIRDERTFVATFLRETSVSGFFPTLVEYRPLDHDCPRNTPPLTKPATARQSIYLPSYLLFSRKESAEMRSTCLRSTCISTTLDLSRGGARRVVQLRDDSRDSSRVSGPRSRDLCPMISSRIPARRGSPRSVAGMRTRVASPSCRRLRREKIGFEGDRGRLRAHAYDRIWSRWCSHLCTRRYSRWGVGAWKPSIRTLREFESGALTFSSPAWYIFRVYSRAILASEETRHTCHVAVPLNNIFRLEASSVFKKSLYSKVSSVFPSHRQFYRDEVFRKV